ncbi:unnamed protein product [Brassica oleracea var. botrytis]|uniref:(rape) hypothetical protein n=1 Tax=Brassica napus TaxID=3708 RepID=A0A816KBA6_BRANA|nr:unnamed protein product [Brassica napus]
MKGRRSLISLQSVELHIWLLTSLLYGKLEAVGTRRLLKWFCLLFRFYLRVKVPYIIDCS